MEVAVSPLVFALFLVLIVECTAEWRCRRREVAHPVWVLVLELGVLAGASFAPRRCRGEAIACRAGDGIVIGYRPRRAGPLLRSAWSTGARSSGIAGRRNREGPSRARGSGRSVFRPVARRLLLNSGAQKYVAICEATRIRTSARLPGEAFTFSLLPSSSFHGLSSSSSRWLGLTDGGSSWSKIRSGIHASS